MISVENATARDVARFYGGIRLEDEMIGLAAKKGRLVLALGGIVKVKDSPWRGFMDIPPYLKSPMIFRYAKRLLVQARAEGANAVRVACDESTPRAAEFLKRLGFVETEEQEQDMVVWEWQA